METGHQKGRLLELASGEEREHLCSTASASDVLLCCEYGQAAEASNMLQ